MDRHRGGRGRRGRGGGCGGGGGNFWQQGGQQQQDYQQGMMGPMGGGPDQYHYGGMMMGGGGGNMGWGHPPDPMMGGYMGGPPPGGGMMMGGGGGGHPGMMEGGGGMMGGGGPMDAGMMPPQFGGGYDDGSMPNKRMRHMQEGMQGGGGGGPAAAAGGGSGDGGQQQQRGPGWGVTIANDYCQNFVDTGLRPQNYLGELGVADPLEGYPMQQALRDAKAAQVKLYTTPPYAIRADLKRLKLNQEMFGTRFDVILIDPPWDEYVRRAPGFVRKDEEVWDWKEIMELDIGAIADNPSVVFLWCGCEEGLDAGRHCLDKWGFRRIEDICWIKTNRQREKEPDRKYLSAQHQNPHSTLVHTKEHCLVGLKGKLTRSQDHAFVHANCDTDIIFSEEPHLGSTEKPEELYNIIERFCNGRRRLELFGLDRNIRPGWVTMGKEISQSNFRPSTYLEHFKDRDGRPYTTHGGYPPPSSAPVLVPTTDVIEKNRPKSPGGHHGR